MTQRDATDPRDLISAATPLPWDYQEGRPYNPALDPVDEGEWPTLLIPASDDDCERLPGMQLFSISLHHAKADADAALIVYAVNNLPALLDVADALERLLGPFDKEPDDSGDENQWWWNHPEWPNDEPMLVGATVGDLRQARAALARLRENQP